MTMTAKFAGKCKRCGGDILVGERIEWARDMGARHASVDQCMAAEPEVAKTSGPSPVAAQVIDVQTIVAFLAAARDRGLKAPRANFVDAAQRVVALSLAKETSQNPGAVYVKVNGEYVGKVAADGKAFGLSTELRDTLTAIATDPAKAAKAYAALTGRCSFCALELTDAGSVEAGYGPVCAKKYGLPHTALGTPSMQTVAA